MKNLVMLLAVVLLAGPALYAGNGKRKAAVAHDSTRVKGKGKHRSAEERAEKYTNWVHKEVTLTADQRQKVMDVNLQIAKKVDELKSNKTGDRKQMKDKRKAIEEERDQMLKPILTPAQWDKYVAAKKKKKEEMKDKKEKKGKGKGKKKEKSETEE